MDTERSSAESQLLGVSDEWVRAMKARTRIGQRGIALFEAMLVTSIGVLISVVLLECLNQGSDFWELSTTQADLGTREEIVMDEMVRELRSATRTAQTSPPKISIPPSPNNTQLTFYLATDLDGNGLILDATGNLEWDTNNPVQYQYAPSTRQLRRLVGATQRVLASDVASVTFADQAIDSSLANNEVKIVLTLQRTTPHQRVVTTTATPLVKLRN